MAFAGWRCLRPASVSCRWSAAPAPSRSNAPARARERERQVHGGRDAGARPIASTNSHSQTSARQLERAAERGCPTANANASRRPRPDGWGTGLAEHRYNGDQRMQPREGAVAGSPGMTIRPVGDRVRQARMRDQLSACHFVRYTGSLPVNVPPRRPLMCTNRSTPARRPPRPLAWAFHVYGVKSRRPHFDDDADQCTTASRPARGFVSAPASARSRDELDPELWSVRRPRGSRNQRLGPHAAMPQGTG